MLDLQYTEVLHVARITSGIDTEMADKPQRAVPAHRMCEDCAVTKITRIHIRDSSSTRPNETRVGAGSKNLLPCCWRWAHQGGHRDCGFVFCEATDMVWIYMMKTDLPTILRDHLMSMKTQGHPVRRFTSNNEPIYAAEEVQNILRDFGTPWEPAELPTPN